MRPCLIAVDLQVAFLGDPDLDPAPGEVLAGAATWLERFREHGLPVVHVRTTVHPGGAALPHWDDRQRRRLAPGAPGWRFAPEAAPREDEAIVDKTHYSAFQSGRLAEHLHEHHVEEVVVIGVHTHGCVRSTALDASAAGLRVAVGLDAIAGNDPPHAAATRRWMGARGFRFVALEQWEAPETEPGPAVDTDGPAARATAAFDAWSAAGLEHRLAALEPLGALLRGESGRLAAAIAQEIRKPLGAALAEVAFAAELADEALARASETTLTTPDGEARRVPHGPTLAVTPWNNPVAIPVGKIVPALAFGNTVVWKPSPRAPAVSAALCELIGRLDLPDGTVERVEGGASAVASLVDGGAIRAVSVTGSLETGRAVQDLCAARLLPLQAELGGNNAAIVCADADVEQAADALVAGAFSFAGQRCTATRRAIVLRDAYEPLRLALMERVEDLRPGDPLSEATTFAPVISRRAAARIETLLDRAAAEGAAVWRPRWAGTAGFGELRGRLPFVAPAVVEDAQPGSEVVQRESFGPVLVLSPVDSLAEAIERCNDVPQGLAASIHTGSRDEAARFARDVRAGILHVNRSTAGAGASLPFGGFGASGLGPPEHGVGDAEFHTRWQAIYGRETEPALAGANGGGDGRGAHPARTASG